MSVHQCPSCGGFCRKSGCERENFTKTDDLTPEEMRAGIALQLREIERLRAENFALAAGQCVSATADDGGVLYCKEVQSLRKERDELQAKLTESALQCLASETQAHEHWEDAQRYQFLRNQPRRKDYYTEEANWTVAREQHGMGKVFRGEELDSQIDAARKYTPC